MCSRDGKRVSAFLFNFFMKGGAMDILSNSAELTAILVLSLGLIKIIEMLVKKIGKKDSALLSDERTWLRNTNEILSKTDSSGVPLVYVPRSCSESQDRLLEKMSAISSSQEKICYILENVVKHLENIELLKNKQ